MLSNTENCIQTTQWHSIGVMGGVVTGHFFRLLLGILAPPFTKENQFVYGKDNFLSFVHKLPMVTARTLAIWCKVMKPARIANSNLTTCHHRDVLGCFMTVTTYSKILHQSDWCSFWCADQCKSNRNSFTVVAKELFLCLFSIFTICTSYPSS